MSKKFLRDMFVTGFALFAMLFGAGNLIFPPHLGWQSASNWFPGFLCFFFFDIGLSLLALFVIIKLGNDGLRVSARLGLKTAKLLMFLTVICIGPLVAVPRTAATTFEIGIQPLLPDFNPHVFSVLFFLIVILLSINQTRAVDIIGAILAPTMFVVLLVLIARGMISPLGTVERTTLMSAVVREGILSGYQTMDMMAMFLFSGIVLLSVTQKGYTDSRQQAKIIRASGILAAAALFVVYGGLAYLGATVSSVYTSDLGLSALLVSITLDLLGEKGIILLGIIVALACLTTAIGLITSSASYFSKLSRGRMSYRRMVIILSAFSCVLSNLGTSSIISLASPILELIYPVLITLTVLGIFDHRIQNDNVFRFAAAGAFLTSCMALIQTIFEIDLGLSFLPLAEFGFGWIIPTIILGILGSLISRKNIPSSVLHN